MAHYDYRCTACNTVFEVEHGMRERPEVTCPDCGAPCTRVLSASGIVFKGSGFYNTDQRGKKGGTAGTGAKKSEGASKKGSSGAGGDAGSASSACEGCAASSSCEASTAASDSAKA